MSRNEQICLSILKSLKLSHGYLMREDILFQTVFLELVHLQVSATEVKDGLARLELAGKIRSERDGYDVVRFVLAEAGRADLLSKGL